MPHREISTTRPKRVFDEHGTVFAIVADGAFIENLIVTGEVIDGQVFGPDGKQRYKLYPVWK